MSHHKQPVHKFITRRKSTIDKSQALEAKWLVQPTLVYKPIIDGNKITIIAQERLEFSNVSKFKFISTGVKLDNVNGTVLCISSHNALTITNPIIINTDLLNILFSFNEYNRNSLIIDAGKPLCVLKFLP